MLDLIRWSLQTQHFSNNEAKPQRAVTTFCFWIRGRWQYHCWGRREYILEDAAYTALWTDFPIFVQKLNMYPHGIFWLYCKKKYCKIIIGEKIMRKEITIVMICKKITMLWICQLITGKHICKLITGKHICKLITGTKTCKLITNIKTLRKFYLFKWHHFQFQY